MTSTQTQTQSENSDKLGTYKPHLLNNNKINALTAAFYKSNFSLYQQKQAKNIDKVKKNKLNWPLELHKQGNLSSV